MQNESRVHKSVINARVNITYYFLFLILSFFSRKIFLDTLGPDFTGLTGTLHNILGYLNLAELGVSTAIAFNLFKPIREDEKGKIIELISLFGYIYRKIGFVVMGTGLVVALFLPLIFKNTIFDNMIIIASYCAFLFSSLYTYFLNYKQVLLTADQKNYVVTIYYQGAQFITVILQMIVAYYFHSYYGYILLQMLYGIAYCLILENRLKKEYPWFEVKIQNGKDLLKKYPQILKSTRQVFVHRIKDFLLTRSDQIFVFAFASLKMVAYYGNYSLVFIKLQSLVTNALDGMGASVGNLVAEGDKRKINNIFWQLISLRYIIAGILCYCLSHLIQPFIHHWLGSEYILGWDIVALLLINFFIIQTRGVVDMFNNAYGHYADTWAAWVEGIINISVTIIIGLKFGIVGILLGKICSMLPIIIFWKPYYLYRDGFKIPYIQYWAGVLCNYAVLVVSWLFVGFIVDTCGPDPMDGYWQFIVSAIMHLVVFSFVYIVLMIKFALGAHDLMRRMPYANKILPSK